MHIHATHFMGNTVEDRCQMPHMIDRENGIEHLALLAVSFACPPLQR